MRGSSLPEIEANMIEMPVGELKRWVTPVVIVSKVRQSQAHVTQFTDGTDTGGNHSQYGS